MHNPSTLAQGVATLIHLMIRAILAQGFRGLRAIPALLQLRAALREFESLVASLQAGLLTAAQAPSAPSPPPSRPDPATSQSGPGGPNPHDDPNSQGSGNDRPRPRRESPGGAPAPAGAAHRATWRPRSGHARNHPSHHLAQKNPKPGRRLGAP